MKLDSSAQNPKTKVVLYVEDDAINRFMVKRLLNESGYQVIEAENGIEGIERAREFKLDLILMDIIMPKLDGFEAVKQIRIFNSEIPIVALTVMFHKKAECISQGFSGFLAKPIEIDRFPGQVKEYLDIERK